MKEVDDMNRKNNKIIVYIKNNIGPISSFISLIAPVVGFVIKTIHDQISYGYSSYYGLQQVSLKNSPVNYSNVWYIFFIVVFVILLIGLSVLVKIDYIEISLCEAIFDVLLFSFILTNCLFAIVFYVEKNNYPSFYIGFLIISIFQILYVVKKSKLSEKIILSLLEILTIYLLSKYYLVKAYIVFSFIMSIILAYSAYCVNIVFPNTKKVHKATILIKRFIKRIKNFKLINVLYNNTRPSNKNNERIRKICSGLLILILGITLFIFGTSKYLFEIGEDLASYNTNNIIAIDGDNTYLCFYTTDNDIVGVPVTIDNINGIEQIRIISKTYKYISKNSNLIYTMNRNKVIGE